MPRLAALLISALFVLGLSAQAASAASLALSAPDQQQPQALHVTASGGAEEPSKVTVYGERGGTSCGATPQEHFNGRSIEFLATTDVATGAFAVQMTQTQGQNVAGVYRFCAYLVPTGGPTATATATTTGRYTAPACPTAAFTITGTSDGGPGGATIGVQVPDGGAISAAGDGGGSGSTSPGAAGPVTFDVLAGPAGQAALSKGRTVTETFTVTFERRLTTPCTALDGSEVTSVRESRQTVVTFKPSGNGGDGIKAPEWFRAVGGADLLNLYGKPGVVNQIGPVCNGGCEEAAATVTIKVSAATQKRYKLPSRTIAKSGAFKPRGEAVVADIKASKAMIKRLKKAKVKKLTTTVTLDARSPIDETVTRKQVFRVGRYTPNSVNYKRFCIGTAKDPICGNKQR